MPSWLLPILVVLAIAAVYWEIRVERRNRDREEAQYDVMKRATGGSVGGRTLALGARSAGSTPARRTPGDES